MLLQYVTTVCSVCYYSMLLQYVTTVCYYSMLLQYVLYVTTVCLHTGKIDDQDQILMEIVGEVGKHIGELQQSSSQPHGKFLQYS